MTAPLGAPAVTGKAVTVAHVARRAGYWLSRADYWRTAPAAELGRWANERDLVVDQCEKRGRHFGAMARRLARVSA